MKFKQLNQYFYISEQIALNELEEIKAQGIKSIICNRPDDESVDQIAHSELENKASELGIGFAYVPISKGTITDEQVKQFTKTVDTLAQPTLAYCRSGMRSISLWCLANAKNIGLHELINTATQAGHDVTPLSMRILNGGETPDDNPSIQHDIVIVGGGAAGIAVAASLIKRHKTLDIAIIEPADTHYYQPGFTMVGAGVFNPQETVEKMANLIPDGVNWIKETVATFEPEQNKVILANCRTVLYNQLIVCPGIKLNWAGIEGLEATLGKNGVTSNYRFDLAPYTWELVQQLKSGKALFTQPPMPIKCAGAPQKVMYLSADYWYKNHYLDNIDIKFMNAGPVLFGVKDYVPALMEYVEKYNAKLMFEHTLFKIDGPNKKAWFKKKNDNGEVEVIEETFDMIHICPPQQSPDFIRTSKLADQAGWVDVDQKTLRHKHYENIYALGDVTNTPNAKTAAAARKQAPIVAHNLFSSITSNNTLAEYDGYGSCPLTVEKGKIVLAEFGYGGKLLPSFPKWFINGKKPTRRAWLLKAKLLPLIYWKVMLKGREWLAKPETQK